MDLGEDEEKTGPKGPKGFHIATFTPKMEGMYTVVGREEQVLQFGDEPKFRSVRSARTAFAALSTPRVATAKKATGFGRTVSIDNVLEIVSGHAIRSRVTKTIGLTLELRYKGKPLSNQLVSVVGRLKGAASAQDLTTDEKGRVKITTGAADSYLVRLSSTSAVSEKKDSTT